ncbi:MAG: hypothetical protein O2962_06315, partial [Cyanobacteria bacterium]|nr:hypothetical protein [Cyanobacteriota bacterium]
MESISTASPATTALEREGPSSQDTSSKATKTTATSSSSNFFDDIGISTTSTLDSDTTTTTFTLIDEDGINGFYSRYKKDDTDTKETKLKKELEAAEAAIKALPESEQSLDPDKDIAVSIFNAKNVEAFGDKAKTQWLNGIRALTKNFNEQSVKRHAYIMSDEGSIWLQKVFSIASLRSEAQNDNLDIVQREAGRLIAGIVQNKMKSTNQKVDSVSLRHINDLFKADNDKAGIEAMLRLVRHIGLRS